MHQTSLFKGCTGAFRHAIEDKWARIKGWALPFGFHHFWWFLRGAREGTDPFTTCVSSRPNSFEPKARPKSSCQSELYDSDKRTELGLCWGTGSGILTRGIDYDDGQSALSHTLLVEPYHSSFPSNNLLIELLHRWIARNPITTSQHLVWVDWNERPLASD